LSSADYRRRDNERLFEADVLSVRAVVGAPQQQHCWIEQAQVSQERSNKNVPAAIAGAVIGGILGHQVGGGTGKNVATGVGIVGGALLGGNVGRNDGDQQQAATRNVQRCSSAPGQGRPAYWDVTYDFRGEEHRVQLTTPPGRTISVNNRGEPRG